MKIPESIITKYKLEPSGEQCGESFMQNLILFKSGLPGFEGIRFMECDIMGKPCKDITFYNKPAKREGIITPEFMEEAPLDIILKLVS